MQVPILDSFGGIVLAVHTEIDSRLESIVVTKPMMIGELDITTDILSAIPHLTGKIGKATLLVHDID